MTTTLNQSVAAPVKTKELTPIEREMGILLRYAPNALDSCDPEKARSHIQSRLVSIGCSRICSRCGGSGQYSWCQAFGSTCFSCNGLGAVVQKITPELLARVKEQIAAGKLDEHLAYLKTKKECKAAFATVSLLGNSGGCFPIRRLYIPAAQQKGAYDIYDLTDSLTVLDIEISHKLIKALKPLKELASAIEYNRKLTQPERQAKVAEFHAQWTTFKALLQDAKKQFREHPQFNLDRIYYCPSKEHKRWHFFFNEEVCYY